MERLDFFRLSRPIQDRLAGVTRGQGVPAPLAVLRSRVPPRFLFWAALGGLGLLALLASYYVGLGNLESSLAIQSTRMIALNAVLGTAFAIGLLRALAVLRHAANLPYRRGVYLFPTVIVDATRRVLRVYRLSQSVRVDFSASSQITLELPEGFKIAFPTTRPEQGTQIAAALAEGQASLAKATASQDKAALAALDPLSEPNFVNPFTPKKALAFESPSWAAYAWAIGPVVGASLGLGVFFLHNRSSDARMLAKAKAANTPRAYLLYLERGGKDRDVREVLLPRAELREAIRGGAVEPVEQFASSHPGSRIEEEIKIALRNSMLIELERLAKQGSVSAIIDFKKRHDTKYVAAELERALHAMYRSAFDRYKTGSSGNPQTLAVIERLLDYAEKRGPRVELRFQRKLGKTVEAADNQIKKSPFFQGSTSFASQYFDEHHARPREQEAGQKIVARFNQAFPPDVLKIELGPPVTDPEAPLPAVSTPTIFVEHLVQCSGPSYLNVKPRGVFVGVGMTYEVSVRLPDEAKPAYKWKTTSWRPPDTNLDPGSSPYEEAVYTASANESYRLFVQRLLQTFFKNPDHAAPTEAVQAGHSIK